MGDARAVIPGARTPDGALYVVNGAAGPADTRTGGVLLTPDGSVHINANAPQRFDQGKGFSLAGDLSIDLAGSPVAGYVGGLPVTANGALKCQLNQPVSPGDAYVGGLRVGPLGGLYVVDTTPPPPTGFSNGFSAGFGV